MIDLVIKVRKMAVYITTGVCFVVATTSQLHGDTPENTVLKAGVAFGVLVCISVVLVSLVDRAARNGTAMDAQAPVQIPPAEDQQPSPEGNTRTTTTTGKTAA
jgi:hypothetical protein